MYEQTEFEKELAGLINSHSKENESNTPDFLLARFLIGCLESYSNVVRARDVWFGRKDPKASNPFIDKE